MSKNLLKLQVGRHQTLARQVFCFVLLCFVFLKCTGHFEDKVVEIKFTGEVKKGQWTP